MEVYRFKNMQYVEIQLAQRKICSKWVLSEPAKINNFVVTQLDNLLQERKHKSLFSAREASSRARFKDLLQSCVTFRFPI